jgi:hypothetical protein
MMMFLMFHIDFFKCLFLMFLGGFILSVVDYTFWLFIQIWETDSFHRRCSYLILADQNGCESDSGEQRKDSTKYARTMCVDR